MRYDINILWIDDTPSWQKEEQELFQLHVEDYGLLVNIVYIENVQDILDSISNEANGFKIYDIIFVDYNISSTILGNQLIDELRNADIDADILFYSANAKNDIKRVIIENGGTFEGIYIANKANFQDKAVMIYKKNIRNLLSISNIRGFLTEKTSENDFTMHSCLMKKYDDLSPNDKSTIISYIKCLIENQLENCSNKIDSTNKLLLKEELNIKKILGLPDYILPIKTKYEILDKILVLLDENMFDENSISDYLSKIIAMRNKVAHKKLDVCRQQQYIKYYDHIDQYLKNQCSNDCLEHSNNGKISIADWMDTLKLTNEYSKIFDQILSSLIQQQEVTA